MAHRFVTDLQEGDTLKQFFLLRRVDPRRTKGGKPYLDVVLGDRTGDIKGKVWEEALQKCSGPLAACDFVAVTGTVEAYLGIPQISLDFIDTVDRLRAKGRPLPDFDPDLLIHSTPHDRSGLWRELLELVGSNLNPPLRDLVLALLNRYQTQLLEWPGAEFYHHAYTGGLLEHTLSVARHAVHSLEVYSQLNRDLVIAGAILHDLGKIKELTGPPCPQRTVPGGLLGHIVLGWEMIREEARALSFPDEQLLISLEHIIIAHHGAQEFGSPVLPRTPEALLVYYLDEIDSKLHMVQRHLETDLSDGDFTSFLKVLGRSLYRPPYLSENSSQTSSPDDV
uniref:HD domain-containing protein n=1 Tax=Desulfobacca acetoxidans TaxID=60893 RepID=A0A7C3Z8P2_9BACT